MTREEMIRLALHLGFEDAALVCDEDAVERLYMVAYAAGVAAEREACAKIAETAEPYQTADLIRARGQA